MKDKECLCCGASLRAGSFDAYFCSKDCLFIYDYALSLLSLTADRLECLSRHYSLAFFICQHPHGEILKALLRLKYDLIQHALPYCKDSSNYNNLKIRVSDKAHLLMEYLKQEYNKDFTYETAYSKITERTCPYCMDIIPRSGNYFCSMECADKYRHLMHLYGLSTIPFGKNSRPLSAKLFKLCANPACAKPFISKTSFCFYCSKDCRDICTSVQKRGYFLPVNPNLPFSIPKALLEEREKSRNITPFNRGSRTQARCVYCGTFLSPKQKATFKKYCSSACRDKVYSRTTF